MGKLTLLTLPIGNVGDITTRVKDVLFQAGTFYAEDTRHFKQLLNHLGAPINGKQIDSFHDHNENKVNQIIETLNSQKEVYLVSDAGSPLISDPAHPLIKSVLENGHELDTYPGVTSPISALELSGLPPIPFHFNGFLPRQGSKIKEAFSNCLEQVGTHIFFESPQRIKASLKYLSELTNDLNICVVREITKKFQSAYRFNIADLQAQDINEKGEFVLLFYVDKSSKVNNSKVNELAIEYLEKKSSPKNLSKLLAEITGRSSKEIYNQLSKM